MTVDKAPLLNGNGLPMPSGDIKILKKGVPSAPADIDVRSLSPL